jgi:hypothetical protein
MMDEKLNCHAYACAETFYMQQRTGFVPDGKVPPPIPSMHGKDQGRPAAVSRNYKQISPVCRKHFFFYALVAVSTAAPGPAHEII